MLLPLHIFEERYRQMVRDCIDNNEPFGVVLIQEGNEVGAGNLSIFNVGTTAHITEVDELDDGRFHIATLGTRRFRIHQLFDHKAPYLVGLVEDFPFEEHDTQLIERHVRALAPVLKAYLEALADLTQVEATIGKIPEDATTLACLAAIILRTSVYDKQQLLSLSSLDEVLEREKDLMRQEMHALRLMTLTAPSWRDETLPFSPN
jgi:Lon protease-like protein